MIASMETYLRRGRRTCQRLLLNPRIRTGGVVLLCGGSGLALSRQMRLMMHLSLSLKERPLEGYNVTFEIEGE